MRNGDSLVLRCSYIFSPRFHLKPNLRPACVLICLKIKKIDFTPIHRSAKVFFLGYVTRPHAQKRVTQPRKKTLAELCTRTHFISYILALLHCPSVLIGDNTFFFTLKSQPIQIIKGNTNVAPLPVRCIGSTRLASAARGMSSNSLSALVVMAGKEGRGRITVMRLNTLGPAGSAA